MGQVVQVQGVGIHIISCTQRSCLGQRLLQIYTVGYLYLWCRICGFDLLQVLNLLLEDQLWLSKGSRRLSEMGAGHAWSPHTSKKISDCGFIHGFQHPLGLREWNLIGSENQPVYVFTFLFLYFFIFNSSWETQSGLELQHGGVRGLTWGSAWNPILFSLWKSPPKLHLKSICPVGCFCIWSEADVRSKRWTLHTTFPV